MCREMSLLRERDLAVEYCQSVCHPRRESRDALLACPQKDVALIMTAANMFTPERRPIDSRGSGKSAVGNGLLSVQAFSWCQNVPKRPSRRPNTRSVEMACLQEWDADRRQAAHAEKSLAVRELVRLSLRVQSTGVVAELHRRHGDSVWLRCLLLAAAELITSD